MKLILINYQQPTFNLNYHLTIFLPINYYFILNRFKHCFFKSTQFKLYQFNNFSTNFHFKSYSNFPLFSFLTQNYQPFAFFNLNPQLLFHLTQIFIKITNIFSKNPPLIQYFRFFYFHDDLLKHKAFTSLLYIF